MHVFKIDQKWSIPRKRANAIDRTTTEGDDDADKENAPEAKPTTLNTKNDDATKTVVDTPQLPKKRLKFAPGTK